MGAIGFDNQKYLTTQSEQIKKRIHQFGGKLYLEFGGKLFDDYHASRVLPGFEPDSKIRMLQQLKDDVEIVIAINAGDIEKNKMRGDLGITYDEDVLRLIDIFRDMGLYVGSVVLTRYSGQEAANAFLHRALSFYFLSSYTIPPLRHFLRVRRPSAKKALQSGAKACIINASNMLTERVRARFCPPAERGAAGCKRPGMVSRRSSLTSGFAEGCGW